MDKIAPTESSPSELRLRAASANAGPTAPSESRRSPAGRLAAVKRPQHWSSSSQAGDGSQTKTSGRQGATGILKKYRRLRLKPRVLLFVCFGAIQVFMLGTFVLATMSIK
jgi:hypothetical protein